MRIEYAGHGKRLEEPFYDSFQDMVSDAKRMIMERMDPTSENAFLGYSMGSLVVYEVLRQWEQTDVSHVFLSAHKPPHLRNAAQRYALASNDNGDIKSWLMEFGGIDDRLKHSRIFWEMYGPIFQKDYELMRDYELPDTRNAVAAAATFFYSEEDTPLTEMKQWDRYFLKECRFQRYSGNHFFIREHAKEMAYRINTAIKCSTGGKI